MTTDELFLHTLDDLEQRAIPGVDEYDVLMSAVLLRKLILDNNRLVDQVNRDRKLQIQFEINEPGEYEGIILSEGPALWALADGLHPQTAIADNRVEVKRNRMLARTVIVAAGIEYSVTEVITITANVLGGVHAGVGTDERERLLAEANRRLQIGGVSAAVQALQPISRVILRGLDPLRTRVRQDLGLI